MFQTPGGRTHAGGTNQLKVATQLTVGGGANSASNGSIVANAISLTFNTNTNFHFINPPYLTVGAYIDGTQIVLMTNDSYSGNTYAQLQAGGAGGTGGLFVNSATGVLNLSPLSMSLNNPSFTLGYTLSQNNWTFSNSTANTNFWPGRVTLNGGLANALTIFDASIGTVLSANAGTLLISNTLLSINVSITANGLVISNGVCNVSANTIEVLIQNAGAFSTITPGWIQTGNTTLYSTLSTNGLFLTDSVSNADFFANAVITLGNSTMNSVHINTISYIMGNTTGGSVITSPTSSQTSYIQVSNTSGQTVIQPTQLFVQSPISTVTINSNFIGISNVYYGNAFNYFSNIAIGAIYAPANSAGIVLSTYTNSTNFSNSYRANSFFGPNLLQFIDISGTSTNSIVSMNTSGLVMTGTNSGVLVNPHVSMVTNSAVYCNLYSTTLKFVTTGAGYANASLVLGAVDVNLYPGINVGNTTLYHTSNSSTLLMGNASVNSFFLQSNGTFTNLVFSNSTGSNLITLQTNGTTAANLVVANATANTVVGTGTLKLQGAGSNTGLTLGTASATANGYTFLPNGLLMQWGIANVNSTLSSVAFPSAFPTGCFSVVLTSTSNLISTSVTYIPSVVSNTTSPSTTSFFMQTANATNTAVFWQAIGH